MRFGDGDDNASYPQRALIRGSNRRMHEYEASLEDLFIVIMEHFGYGVKSSEDLLASPAEARRWSPRINGRFAPSDETFDASTPVTGKGRMDTAVRSSGEATVAKPKAKTGRV